MKRRALLSTNQGFVALLVFLLVSILASPATAEGSAYNDAFFEALSRETKRDYTGALAALDKAISLDQKSADPLAEKAAILTYLKRYKEGREYGKKAVAIDAKRVRALEAIAVSDYQEGKLSEAVKGCRAVMELNPENQRCELVLKSAYVKTGGKSGPPREASPFMNDTKLVEKVRSLTNDQKFEQAVNLVTEHLKTHPRDRGAYLQRAYVFETARQLDGAIRDYTTVLAMHPKDHRVLRQRAQAYEDIRHPEMAVNDLYELITLSPTHTNHRYRLAYSLTKAGRLKEAIDQYSGLIILNPTSLEALNGRGQCYLDLKEHKKAIEDFSRYIELSPHGSGAPFYKRALAYSGLGDKKNADSDFAMAKKLGYQSKNSNPRQGVK